jgi:V/A-type H+/Na+-transporting ATPase subunit K
MMLAVSLFLVQPVRGQTAGTGDPTLAAAVVAGLALLGAGIGLGIAGSAAIGAVSEKPEMFSLSFVYIVFVEAIAVYGLVLAFLILGRA